MSAWLDRPSDFADWLRDDGSSFAQRREFGRYLRQALEEADGVAQEDAACVSAQPVDAGWSLQLSDGRQVDASALVLANGNQPPAMMAVGQDLPGELFINNPWSADAAQAVERVAQGGGDVLILGTGLTMIDTVLSLDAAGHRGRVVVLSRRGLVPRAHAPYDPAPVGYEDVPRGRVLALWRWVRQQAEAVDWRAAVDSLRPHSQSLWQSLPPAEQRRFLRHARPWWDVHRHRIAPAVAARLDELVAEGRLEIMAGRVRTLRADGDALAATVVPRGSGAPIERRFALAVNCTGPLGEMRRTADPLLRQMLNDRLIGVDDLGIGLRVADSRAGNRLWAVGPLTKGMYWEIVAVPDIRGQVAGVAQEIARELRA